MEIKPISQFVLISIFACVVVALQPTASWSGNLSGSVENTRKKFDNQVENYETQKRAKEELRRKRLANQTASQPVAGGLVVAPSSNTNKNKKGVKAISRDGNFTIIQCMDGRKREVFHDPYGKCTIPSTLGSYTCDWAVKDTAKSCG